MVDTDTTVRVKLAKNHHYVATVAGKRTVSRGGSIVEMSRRQYDADPSIGELVGVEPASIEPEGAAQVPTGTEQFGPVDKRGALGEGTGATAGVSNRSTADDAAGPQEFNATVNPPPTTSQKPRK